MLSFNDFNDRSPRSRLQHHDLVLHQFFWQAMGRILSTFLRTHTHAAQDKTRTYCNEL